VKKLLPSKEEKIPKRNSRRLLQENFIYCVQAALDKKQRVWCLYQCEARLNRLLTIFYLFAMGIQAPGSGIAKHMREKMD